MSACTSSSSSGIDAATLTCPPDSTLTYENFGRVVIEEQCLSCHATKERPHLDTAEAVRSNRQAIIRSAVTGTSMPKGGGMLLDEREMLGEWLTCGAP